MSVTSGSDTDLPRIERNTLFAFLGLYAGFTLLVLVLVGMLYFRFSEEIMLEQKRLTLLEHSNTHIADLRHLHVHFDRMRTYPRHDTFNSAIYDWDERQIFSTLQQPEVRLEKVIYRTGDKIHFIREPESYYLGAKYVILEINDEQTWLTDTYRTIVMYGSLLFALFLVIGWFLMRLFLRPMRRALEMLDQFIKDTTHELNTPITAILTNIEAIDTQTLESKHRTKLERIKIGAQTVSDLYQDLTYLLLNHQVLSQNESVDMEMLLKERIEYFSTTAKTRRLTIVGFYDLNSAITIDRKKMTRLIDNLISNAIKYNKPGGRIEIRLHAHCFSVKDTGRGIPKDKINYIHERYSRFDASSGGFGIGLHIVAMIAREYDLEIHYESEPDIGTEVTVSWKK